MQKDLLRRNKRIFHHFQKTFSCQTLSQTWESAFKIYIRLGSHLNLHPKRLDVYVAIFIKHLTWSLCRYLFSQKTSLYMPVSALNTTVSCSQKFTKCQGKYSFCEQLFFTTPKGGSFLKAQLTSQCSEAPCIRLLRCCLLDNKYQAHSWTDLNHVLSFSIRSQYVSLLHKSNL